MGLDTVELLMAVEDAFGIRIMDGHVEHMRTVGELVDYVVIAVGRLDPGWKQIALEKLDARTQAVVGRKVSDLPRDTKIVDLLEVGKEAEQWEALGGLPALVQPGWSVWTVRLSSWGAGCSFFGWCYPEAIVFGAVGAVVVVGISFAVLGGLTAPLRRIPRRDLTIQQWIWWREAEGRSESRQAIFEKVAELIVDYLGVERHEVREEARFIEDLRIE